MKTILRIRRRNRGGYGFKYKKCPTGLLITAIKSDGAAAALHIQIGDIIRKIGGESVLSFTEEQLNEN